MDNKNIICFDINGTLTDSSTWAMFESSEITKKELKDLIKRYAAGEFSIKDLWNAMLKVFQNTNMANKDFIYNFWENNLNLKPGARELMDYLKSKDYHIYLISCSVDVYAEIISKDLGIKGFFTGTNLIFSDSGELIGMDGECRGNKHFKRDKLMQLASREGVSVEDIIFVGDDENDIEVFKMTGHGIAMDSNNQELIDNSWKQIKALAEIIKIL